MKKLVFTIMISLFLIMNYGSNQNTFTDDLKDKKCKPHKMSKEHAKMAKKHFKMFNKFLKEQKISKKTIKKAHKELRKIHKIIRKNFGKRKDMEFKKAFLSDKFDTEAIKNKAYQKIDNMKTVIPKITPIMNNIVKLFTKEQRKALVAFAKERHDKMKTKFKNMRKNRKHKMGDHFKKLGLTKEQQAEMKKLRDGKQKTKKDHKKGKFLEAYKMLMDAFIEGNITDELLYSIWEKQSENMKKHFAKMIDFSSKMHSILTEKQRKIFVKKMRKHRGHGPHFLGLGGLFGPPDFKHYKNKKFKGKKGKNKKFKGKRTERKRPKNEKK